MRSSFTLAAFVLISSLVLMLASPARALHVTVAANGEECFFDDVRRGEKARGSWNVVSGGFLDVDVRVYGPDNVVIYEVERQTDGAFQFVGMETGTHRLCFGNTMSTVTPKGVAFSWAVGTALSSHGVAKKEHFTPLENAILLLSEGLRQTDNEVRYITARNRVCKETSESTNARVLWWNFAQLVVFVIVAIAQVAYLKAIFNKK